MYFLQYTQILILFFSRYGEQRGTGAGRSRLPHALPPGLPRVAAWDDEAVLEEGARRKADVRIHPVLPGRLLYSYRATIPAWGQPLVLGFRLNSKVHWWRSKKCFTLKKQLKSRPWQHWPLKMIVPDVQWDQVCKWVYYALGNYQNKFMWAGHNTVIQTDGGVFFCFFFLSKLFKWWFSPTFLQFPSFY